MRKTIYIVLIIGILISCSGKNAISEIKNYVNNINNRTDLNESITEFNTENQNGEIIGGTSIYELTDNDNKLFRIITEVSQPNDSVFNYEFYYKDRKLIFAKVVKFSNNSSEFDTIVNSVLYYKNGKLIEQLNQKPTGIDSKYVQLLAESFAVEGLGTE